MEEIWKSIVIEQNGVLYDFTGMYEVSNLGRIRNSKTKNFIKAFKNNDGYLKVSINKKRSFFVHRLVATMFIPNDGNLLEVDHINCIRDDNRIENLRWCDRKENMDNSNIKTKVVCIETGEVFNSIKEAQTWCGKIGVKDCCRGRQKTCGGYHWRYTRRTQKVINKKDILIKY